MTMLVLAEHDNQTLNPITLNVVTAAVTLGESIDLLVAGYQCQSVVEQAQQIAGVNQVLLVDHANYQ